MKISYLFAALLLPGFLWAQAPDENKEVEQIVITKKGPVNEKLNIVVDGERVTVNGDPLNNNDKNAEISVTRRKIKDPEMLVDEDMPGERRVIRRFQVGPGGQPAQVAPMPPNKAMLGIATSKGADGVEVMAVTKESAAEIAGLKQGDIILEVERNKIEKPDDITRVIRDKNPGDKITILYLRDNKQRTAVAELKKWSGSDFGSIGAMPEFPNFDIEEFRSRLGDLRNRGGDIQLRAFGFPNRAKLGIKIQDLEKGSGVKVIEVENGSDAAKAGLKQGDVIKKVDGKAVTDADDMRMKVSEAKPGDDMQIGLERSGREQNVKVQFSKKIKTAEL